MQIHELQERQGGLDVGVYLATDDGDTTEKIDYTKLAEAIIEQYTGSSISGSYQTVKDAIEAVEASVEDAVKTSDIVNNLVTTAAGKVLDARQGKTLNDSISASNAKSSRLSISVAHGATTQYDFGSAQTFRILLTGHNSVAGFRGLYILSRNIINPVILATSYTVSINETVITIVNTATGGTVTGVII